jgi:hypothetical protein
MLTRVKGNEDDVSGCLRVRESHRSVLVGFPDGKEAQRNLNKDRRRCDVLQAYLCTFYNTFMPGRMLNNKVLRPTSSQKS